MISIQNRLAHIKFGGSKSNALSLQELQQLSQNISHLGSDPKIDVILLSSEGDNAFCAGASFSQLSQIESINDAEIFFDAFAKLLCSMRDCPKIMVLQVQGKATGGAVGLIAAADYVVASPQAAVALTEIKIGLGPFVIGPFVARKVGAAAFGSMALDAKFRDAHWALQHHLFDVLSPSHASLSQSTDAFLSYLLDKNPSALAKIKQMAWEGHGISDALLNARKKISAELLLSPETKAKIADFLRR